MRPLTDLRNRDLFPSARFVESLQRNAEHGLTRTGPDARAGNPTPAWFTARYQGIEVSKILNATVVRGGIGLNFNSIIPFVGRSVVTPYTYR